MHLEFCRKLSVHLSCFANNECLTIFKRYYNQFIYHIKGPYENYHYVTIIIKNCRLTGWLTT